MSATNGTPRPAGSPYRRAVERHRAERAAWQRVRAAQKELQAAAAAYNQLRWSDLPLINGLVERTENTRLPAGELNGLVDLVDLHARMRNPELTEAFLAEKEADRNAELADEGLTEEAAELPAGGDPRVQAFVEREKATARKKRIGKHVPPADPALDRLGKLLDGQDPSRQTDSQDQGLPDQSLSALDRAILHAVDAIDWEDFVDNGADDKEIEEQLNQIWPRSRYFVPGNLPYTIQSMGAWSAIWLGPVKHDKHKADLSGPLLIQRIRALLEIPTRDKGAKAAQDSFREPTITQKRKGGGLAISPPDLGWTEDDQVHAAIQLGVSIDNLIICDNCESARARQLHPCPVCQSRHYRLRDTPAVYASPLHKESGTSKVPPASVEMPKRGRKPNGMADPARPGKHWLAITAPEEGWDDANLANAAEDLETGLGHVNLCNKCSAARRIAIHPCPMCGSPEYRAALGGINGEPVPQPAKRGRGRPRKEPVS
jgi:hypothetical protein